MFTEQHHTMFVRMCDFEEHGNVLWVRVAQKDVRIWFATNLRFGHLEFLLIVSCVLT